MKTIEPVIYGLVDPRTSRIRYVGQSIDVDRRFAQHCEFIDSTHKGLWVQELRLAEFTPRVVVLEKVSDVNRLTYCEKWWISLGKKQGWQLLNSANPTTQKASFDELFSSSLAEIYSNYANFDVPVLVVKKVYAASVLLFLISLLSAYGYFLFAYSLPSGGGAYGDYLYSLASSVITTLICASVYAKKQNPIRYLYASPGVILGIMALWGWF